MTTSVLSLLSAASLEEFYTAGHWREETIYELVRVHARRAPGRIALRDRHRTLTYGQMVAAADIFAAELARRGVKQGQRVALWMPTRIESVVALLACSRDGLVYCPSPHRNHTVAEVVRLMERMQASAFIHQTGFGADADRRDVAAEIRHLGSLRHIYRLEPAGPDTAEPFAGIPAGASPGEPAKQDPNRVSYLAFTSGSTGEPKGVMHSDNTLLVTARAIAADWRLGPESVVYSLSPLSHNLGVGTLLTALVAGCEFVIHDVRRGESLVDRLVETATIYLVGVPTHAIDLLAEMRRRGLSGLGHVKSFRISGAAAPGHVFEALLQHGVIPQSGYGMTETNAHQYTLPDDDPALIIGTSGKACAGYEIRVWHPDDPDVELPAGEIGQIGGRGASLMLGYFDDQIATEDSFNSHGWFMTGDLGWVDERGYLRITGRKKEVIIRGGHNINPARIEELAMKHEAVERAAAIPLADARLGERVCLAVMLRPGAAAAAEEILDHLGRAGLSKYQMPEFFMRLDDIPLMPNGKMHRRDILKWIRDGRVAPSPVRRPDEAVREG